MLIRLLTFLRQPIDASVVIAVDRNYLPDDIIEHLDKVFTPDWEDYYDC